LLDAGVDVSGDAAELLVADQRAHLGGWVHAGADLIFEAIWLTPFNDLVVDLSWTMSRDPAQQHWPWLKKMALAAPAMALSRSASGKTIAGLLPPSSRVTFFRFPAAA
jgi:hypothetical protein